MKLSEFDYTLPKELIAQYPAGARDKCRLMVLDRAKRSIEHRTFGDIIEYFERRDCLVLNDTKVIPARLFGRRKTGGKVEIFILEKKASALCSPTSEGGRTASCVCEALLKPAARLKEGEKILLESGDEAEVLNRGEAGRFVKFNRPLDDILKEAGHVPLPPYMDRIDEESDRIDYQTVYASREGATASPTAGLHFTRELLERIASCAVHIAYVTLHTNYGTFAPIKEDVAEKHKMHKEYFEISAETIDAINDTKKSGGKVFAVGTTTNRVLEHCAENLDPGTIRDWQRQSRIGYTGLFIYPGYDFKIVDHLITNFHLPKSTLLLLVSAFAGKDFILEAYREAIANKYRFYSYGDAMLII